MKIATMLNSPEACACDAAELESLGYDALFANESKHDPFIKSALIADRTRSVEVVTYIAVAFARTPMLAAASANDVNALSAGKIHPRAWFTGEAPHHEALFHALVASGTPNAGIHPCASCHLGYLV